MGRAEEEEEEEEEDGILNRAAIVSFAGRRREMLQVSQNRKAVQTKMREVLGSGPEPGC
jgi:hypothetical protein